MGSHRVRHDWSDLAAVLLWRRQWHPTPVLLPGKSHGQRSLIGCSPWGHEESDTTERLTLTFHFHALEKEMATHSSSLAWKIPGTGDPGWAAVYGVAQSQTRLKRLSSSSSTFSQFYRKEKLVTSYLRQMKFGLRVGGNGESRKGEWKLLTCPTLCDPLDYTVHGILQARILEWVAFPFSRQSS